MEIEKDFMDVIQNDIAPIINECFKNKHRLHDIKIYETLRVLRENNKINFYDMQGHATYLYIVSKIYTPKPDYHYYYIYKFKFITVDDPTVIFEVSKIYVGKYAKPTEVSRIFINTKKMSHFMEILT